MGRGTLPEVRDGSEDPARGQERAGGPSQKSGMGRRTRLEVRDGLGDF